VGGGVRSEPGARGASAALLPFLCAVAEALTALCPLLCAALDGFTGFGAGAAACPPSFAAGFGVLAAVTRAASTAGCAAGGGSQSRPCHTRTFARPMSPAECLPSAPR
jgi:hypothetical protein